MAAFSASRARNRAQLAFAIFLLIAGFIVQLTTRPSAANGLLRVRVLDVGQGDSILIDTPTGEHLLIDGGPDDVVLGQLVKYLAPPQRFALVVASHNDADHITGLPAVLGRYAVERVWVSGATHTTGVYERWLRAIQDSGAQVEAVHAGREQRFGDLVVRVLNPPQDFTGTRPEEQHEATVVLKLIYGATSILLTGDLDEAQETTLAAADPAVLAATALKVSHHGSKNGTTLKFLDAVHPQITLISVGRDNKFGHPTPTVLDRLSSRGIQIGRTDEQGTLTVTSDGFTAHFETER